jgi:hypothetical protein
MSWYARFLRQFARQMALRSKRAGLGAWAVGHPLRELNLWPYYTDALLACREHRAVLTRHEYGPLDGYHCLRYRWDNYEFMKLGYPNLPVIISECGTDNAGGYRPWRPQFDGDIRRSWSELLLPYTLAMQADPYCLGGTVFTVGGAGGWNDFEVSGTGLVDLLIDHAKQPHPEEQIVIHTFIIDQVPDNIREAYVRHLNDLTVHVNAGQMPYAYGPGVVPVYTLRNQTNQDVINLFDRAFGRLLTADQRHAALHRQAVPGTLGRLQRLWRALGPVPGSGGGGNGIEQGRQGQAHRPALVASVLVANGDQHA